MSAWNKWSLSLVVHGSGYGLLVIGLICALWGEDPWPVWLPGCAVVVAGCMGEIRTEKHATLFRVWRMALEDIQSGRLGFEAAVWRLAA